MDHPAYILDFNNILALPAYFGALLGVSFLLVHVWGRRLPEGTDMGLVMSLFLPAFGHLYVYKARSLWYVGGLLVLGWTLQWATGWWPSTLVVTALSFGLMYRRRVVKDEGAPPANPDLYTLSFQVDASTLARFNDYLDASGLPRDAAAARAIEGLPLEAEEDWVVGAGAPEGSLQAPPHNP